MALFREPAAAGDSALVRHLESHGPKTLLAISHIRRATQGLVALANTQPFARELGGRTHVFAHNGNLSGILDSPELSIGTCRPVGQTDSELAFCALLSRLRTLWSGTRAPTMEARSALVAAFAADLRALGPANFLYADGDVLFAHGHRRIQRTTGRVEAPGLWILQRRCTAAAPPSAHQEAVSIAPGDQAVVLIASVPLTEEAWRPLSEGEVVIVRNGEVVTRRAAKDEL